MVDDQPTLLVQTGGVEPSGVYVYCQKGSSTIRAEILLTIILLSQVGCTSGASEATASTAVNEVKVERLLSDSYSSDLYCFAWTPDQESPSKDFASYLLRRVNARGEQFWEVKFRSPLLYFPLPERIYTNRGNVLLVTGYVSHVAISRYVMIWDSSGSLRYQEQIVGNPLIAPNPADGSFLIVRPNPEIRPNSVEQVWELTTIGSDGSVRSQSTRMPKGNEFNSTIGTVEPMAVALIPDARILFVGSYDQVASQLESGSEKIVAVCSWVLEKESGNLSHISSLPLDSVSSAHALVEARDLGFSSVVSTILAESEIGFLVITKPPSIDTSSQIRQWRVSLVRFQPDGTPLVAGISLDLPSLSPKSELVRVSKHLISQRSFTRESCELISLDFSSGFLVHVVDPQAYVK